MGCLVNNADHPKWTSASLMWICSWVTYTDCWNPPWPWLSTLPYSQLPRRFHHLQGIMGLFSEREGRNPTSKEVGEAFLQGEDACPEKGNGGKSLRAEQWHSTGASVGWVETSIALGPPLDLPSLGSGSRLHTSSIRTTSLVSHPLIAICRAVKHHFQRKVKLSQVGLGQVGGQLFALLTLRSAI